MNRKNKTEPNPYKKKINPKIKPIWSVTLIAMLFMVLCGFGLIYIYLSTPYSAINLFPSITSVPEAVSSPLVPIRLDDTWTPEPPSTPVGTPTRRATITVEPTFTPISVTIIPSPNGSSITPNSMAESRIVFSSNRNGQYDIFSMKPDGSDVIQITDDAAWDDEPVWSPDQKQIAFISYVTYGDSYIERSKIFLINADGSDQRMLLDRPSGELFPSWSPDGLYILYSLRFIFRARIDGSQDELLLVSPDDLLRSPTWSPDGRQVAFTANTSTGSEEIRILSRNSMNVRNLTPGNCPAWSPDGQQIAFGNNVGKQGDIFVINADGSGLRQLTTGTENDIWPDWSPDGKYIVFTSDRNGNNDIYVMNADGSNQTRITNNRRDDHFPAWRK